MGKGGVDTRTPEEKDEDDRRIKERDDQKRKADEALAKRYTCTPFPVPVQEGDRPLAIADAADYLCGGCGTPVPSGAWLLEEIEDGMVIGLRVQLGSDGAVVHECHRDGLEPPTRRKGRENG